MSFPSTSLTPRRNRWGEPIWNTQPGERTDLGSRNNPASAVRNALASQDHASSLSNPWVRYMSKAAPVLDFMYTSGPGGQQARGFDTYVQDFVRQAQAGGGNLPDYKDMLNALGSLFNGSNPTLNAAFATTDADQAEQLGEVLQGMGMLSMGGLAGRALSNDFRNAQVGYEDAMAANPGLAEGFLDYLGRTGWLQTWLPGYQYNGMAPRMRQSIPGAAPMGAAAGGRAGSQTYQ